MHIFHNILFEADIKNSNPNTIWEHEMTVFIQDQLLPKLEGILDVWAKIYPQQQIIINTIDLDVDIDTFDAKLITNQLVDQFKAQLEQINVKDPESTKQLTVKIIPKATVFEAFIYYLKTGLISKAVTVKQLKHWIKNKTTFSKEEHHELQQLVVKHASALQRLHQSFYDTSYKKVAEFLNINSIISHTLQIDKVFVKTMLQQVNHTLKTSISNQKIEVWSTTLSTSTSIKRYAETFVKLLLTSNTIHKVRVPSAEKLEIAIVQALLQYQLNLNINIPLHGLIDIDFTKPLTSQKTISEDLQNIDADSTEEEPKNSSLNNVKPEVSDKINDASAALEKQKDDSTNIDAVNAQKLIKLLADKGIQTHNTNYKNKTSTQNDEDLNTFETNNLLADKNIFSTEKAGLILVHPFLNTLFKELQLIDSAHNISKPKKAAVLLHYLATGHSEFSDLELVLEKILLNIPLQEIISKNITLNRLEKEAADTLLTAVLQHWTALKNSSIDTLRNMFIKREGHIQKHKKAVTITVERLAQDILLDKLPWGIGMIRLPWKKKFITVEW